MHLASVPPLILCAVCGAGKLAPIFERMRDEKARRERACQPIMHEVATLSALVPTPLVPSDLPSRPHYLPSHLPLPLATHPLTSPSGGRDAAVRGGGEVAAHRPARVDGDEPGARRHGPPERRLDAAPGHPAAGGAAPVDTVCYCLLLSLTVCYCLLLSVTAWHRCIEPDSDLSVCYCLLLSVTVCYCGTGASSPTPT